MERCDVLVVGGGPAGAACAWKLRRSGFDVAVLDKQTFPRDKVCAGWITPAVVEALQLDLDAYARARTLQPLTGFRTSMLGCAEAQVGYAEPVSYGIRRCEFDDYLLKRSGARLLLGEPLKDLRAGPDGAWIVNARIRTPLVIGAGGHFCPVARQLGARPGRGEAAITAKEIEFEMTPAQARACRVSAEVPELVFSRDLRGYGWLFRKGDWLNVGFGHKDRDRFAGALNRFMDHLGATGKVPEPVPSRLQGHAYLLYGETPRRIVDDGVLLVGDAAGLAYTESGEGIRPGVESALLAADVVAGCRGAYSEDALRAYADRLERRFGRRTGGEPAPADPAAQTGIAAAVERRLAARLLGTRWFARNVVLNRWFFHLHQPALQI